MWKDLKRPVVEFGESVHFRPVGDDEYGFCYTVCFFVLSFLFLCVFPFLFFFYVLSFFFLFFFLFFFFLVFLFSFLLLSFFFFFV